MNKKLFLLPVLAMAVGALVGCGKKDPTPTPTPTTHTVTWNLNYEGAPAATSTVVNDGVPVSKPTDPSRAGYKFDDWFTTAACTTKYDITEKVTKDLTLFAGWIKSCTVTFLYNYEGAENPVYKTESVLAGELVDQPESPTRTDGYIFDTWTVGPDAESDEFEFFEAITTDTNVYAQWEEDPYKYFPTEEIENYLGFYAKEPYNVTVPEYDAPRYEPTQYADAFVIESESVNFESAEEYIAAFVDAGWTDVTDPEQQIPTLQNLNGGLEVMFGFTQSKSFQLMMYFVGTETGFKRGTEQDVYSFPAPSTTIFKSMSLYAASMTDGSIRTALDKYELAEGVASFAAGVELWLEELKATGLYTVKAYPGAAGLYIVTFKNWAFGGFVGSYDGEAVVQFCNYFGTNAITALTEDLLLKVCKFGGLLGEDATETLLPQIPELQTRQLVALGVEPDETYVMLGYLNLPAIPAEEQTITSKVEYWSGLYEAGLVTNGWVKAASDEDSTSYVNPVNGLYISIFYGADTAEGSAIQMDLYKAEKAFPAETISEFLKRQNGATETTVVPSFGDFYFTTSEEEGQLTVTTLAVSDTTQAIADYTSTLVTAGWGKAGEGIYVSSTLSVVVKFEAVGSSSVELTISSAMYGGKITSNIETTLKTFCTNRTGAEFLTVTPTGEGVVSFDLTTAYLYNWTEPDGTNVFESTVVTNLQGYDLDAQASMNTATMDAYGIALHDAYLEKGFEDQEPAYATYAKWFFDLAKVVDNGDGTSTVTEISYQGREVDWNTGKVYLNLTNVGGVYCWYYILNVTSYVIENA